MLGEGVVQYEYFVGRHGKTPWNDESESMKENFVEKNGQRTVAVSSSFGRFVRLVERVVLDSGGFRPHTS